MTCSGFLDEPKIKFHSNIIQCYTYADIEVSGQSPLKILSNSHHYKLRQFIWGCMVKHTPLNFFVKFLKYSCNYYLSEDVIISTRVKWRQIWN